MNGVWGTIAVGIFGRQGLGGLARSGLLHGGGFKLLGIQTLGTLSAVIFVIVAMTVIFKGIDTIVGLRVSREEELKGLDLSQHGMDAYAGFQIFTIK